MTTTPGIAGLPSSTAASPNLGGSSQLDRDTFLKLMVAQLKYQDPSKPVDSAQFIAQSAQFTMVERLEEMATSAKESAVAQRSSLAAGYLGRSITGVDANSHPVNGLVTSVDLSPDGVVLHVGDVKVPLAGVASVSLPPAPAPTPTAAPAPASSTPPAPAPAPAP